MRMIYGVLISFVLCGCATDEHGRLINQDEVLWIEKGITTRTQVVEHFGSPRFEGALPSTTTSTTTATIEGKSHTTITTVHVDELPTQTKAIYPYTRFQSTTPFYVKVDTSEFWLVYDEHGVVQGYGFVDDVPASRSPADSVIHRPTS